MNPAVRFFILLIAIYLTLYAFHVWVILPYGKVDDFLNYILSLASYESLQVLGVESFLKIIPQNPISNYYVYLGNQAVVSIGSACNGLLLYILFTCFIFLSAGKWWQKVLFVSAGIAVIFVLNVLRVIALLYLLTVSPTLFEINHHYVFSFVVYVCIFFMWQYWLNRVVQLY
jgi:exosortase/archaeosortase family protein